MLTKKGDGDVTVSSVAVEVSVHDVEILHMQYVCTYTCVSVFLNVFD